MDWYTFVALEAAVAGISTIVIEVRIIAALVKQRPRRILYYYHALPLLAGGAMMLSARDVQDVPMSLCATLASCITGLNMYNTYYVHVVLLRNHVADLRLDTPTHAIGDLFLPAYKDSFFPWGPIVQIAWSLMMCMHVVVRSYATGLLLA